MTNLGELHSAHPGHQNPGPKGEKALTTLSPPGLRPLQVSLHLQVFNHGWFPPGGLWAHPAGRATLFTVDVRGTPLSFSSAVRLPQPYIPDLLPRALYKFSRAKSICGHLQRCALINPAVSLWSPQGVRRAGCHRVGPWTQHC